MEKYVTTVDRQEGKGMDLTTIWNALLHTPVNISLFGCVAYFVSNPLESTHKDTCKKLSTIITEECSDLLEN
jgi:hypothetical protein